MKNKVLDYIKSEKLIEKGDNVIVALSGGADSVFLFNILISVKEILGITVEAFHMNHGIRGEEAIRDQEFCVNLCKSLGVKIYLASENVIDFAKENKIGEEEAGRVLRYKHFNSLAEKYNSKIATAHNKEDNAETLLLNIARGTSLKGLSGIPSVRGKIIRPILNISREEIEKYLLDNDIPFVTDSTNLTDDYSRNKIRHNVLPVMKEINSGFLSSVEKLNTNIKEIYDYISLEANKALENAEKDGFYDTKVLCTYNVAVRKQVASTLLKNYGIEVNSNNINFIDNLFFESNKIDISKNYYALSYGGLFRFVEKTKNVGLKPTKIKENGSFFYNNKQYEYSYVKISGKLSEKALQNMVKFDIMCPDTCFRNRREGDTFKIPKRNVTKSLKKLMNELKIPVEKRDSLVLLANGSKILWIEGIGPCAEGYFKSSSDYYFSIKIDNVKS
ncbi:MAG: tRNA lysidine(34) synthetase TilS [Acutalibacteraceae bacterium]